MNRRTLTTDELIAQVMDDAVPDEGKSLRGELARRLMVCEQLCEASNKSLWDEGFTTAHPIVGFLEVIRKMQLGES